MPGDVGLEDMGLEDVGPEALIRKAQSGDDGSRAALSLLLSRLYPRLLTYLRGLAAGKEASEDACQETMVRIVTHLTGFVPRGGVGAWASFQAWAFTTASNVYKDHLRKSARLVPVAGVPEDRRPAFAPEASAGHVPATEESAMDEMGAQSLMDALFSLPAEQRQVFLLKAYYGYSYGEIARIAGCPEGTAKSRLHHAVRTLRDELRDELRDKLKGSGAL